MTVATTTITDLYTPQAEGREHNLERARLYLALRRALSSISTNDIGATPENPRRLATNFDPETASEAELELVGIYGALLLGEVEAPAVDGDGEPADPVEIELEPGERITIEISDAERFREEVKRTHDLYRQRRADFAAAFDQLSGGASIAARDVAARALRATEDTHDPTENEDGDETPENRSKQVPWILKVPDIYETPPADHAGRKAAAERNLARARLYLALRDVLRENFSFDPDGSTTEDSSTFPAGFGLDGSSNDPIGELMRTELVKFVSIYGLLLTRNVRDPSFGRHELETSQKGKDVRVATIDQSKTIEYVVDERFVAAVTRAYSDFSANRKLFEKVATTLAAERFFEIPQMLLAGGDGSSIGQFTVYASQIAEVALRLAEDEVDADTPQIRRHVLKELEPSLKSGQDYQASGFDLDLPNLDAATPVDIIPDNVQATKGIYFSAMLEEMKLHAVMQKVVEHYLNGVLPLSRGPAAKAIYKWIRNEPQRFTEYERRSFYERVLGFAVGGANGVGSPNREFQDLWLRFLSSISMMSREENANIAKHVQAEQVHKAGRDLAVNLSLHGYGVAYDAALEMKEIIEETLSMLSDAEVLRAYGVNDMWQLCDRVSEQYLGGSVNGVRYRTMAQSGAAIINWLATHARVLASVSTPVDDIFKSEDLKIQAERWLAVTGTGFSTIEKRTDPVDMATQPTFPSFSPNAGLPQPVQDALDQVGADLPSMPNLPTIPQA